MRPARVAAVALNTSTLDEDAARAAVAEAERVTGLPADDVVRFGADRVLDAVLAALPHRLDMRAAAAAIFGHGPCPQIARLSEHEPMRSPDPRRIALVPVSGDDAPCPVRARSGATPSRG